MRTLVLWDIDGTLLTGDGVAGRSFNRALVEIYELDTAPARIEYGGKTDSQIALEILALHNIEAAPALERLARFHQHYAMLVEDAYEDLCAGMRVLPGVHAVLDALDAAGAIQSLLTGNLRPTAELKLRAAGLAERFNFDVGAFGSDHHNRDELVPIARAKSTARFGRLDDVVVIGDTPRDIACGKAGGARTVAVATGHWDAERLRQHAPDIVLDNLVDTEAAVRAIIRPNYLYKTRLPGVQ